MNELNELRTIAMRHLKLLSKSFPNIQLATTEIINLEAILNLPKGTEHFLSDLHGEDEAFLHVLKNASGVVKRKIDDVFKDNLSIKEKKRLATIIYYPKDKLNSIREKEDLTHEWYVDIIYKLVKVCRATTSKYTRSRVRKILPKDYAYIIEELLSEQERGLKDKYYNSIIDTIINLKREDHFIENLARVIKRLTIDRLHIIGDIYDRGPGAEIIMDRLLNHHSVDIQWGNHDIIWMAAASGHKASIANVVRISLRYANLKTLENGYGINLMPLTTFALNIYKDDNCNSFIPKERYDYSKLDIDIISKMHKTISIIQFKLESQIIKKRKSYNMEDRLLLDKIDYKRGIITIKDKEYSLNDTNFPTIDPKDPYRLTKDEENLIDKLQNSFLTNEKLQRHIKFLFAKGSIYLKFNNNLMFHGSIPLNKNGELRDIKVNSYSRKIKGKEYLDYLEKLTQNGYFETKNSESKELGMDTMWYLWCGANSPLYGKDKMATFERYFLDDIKTHKEKKDPYFKFRDTEESCDIILKEFGLNPKNSHIINGHVPVKVKKGENPVKANKKLIAIDGGLSKAYQKVTGIAGYTLIYNSYGLLLTSHEPFTSREESIKKETDIHSYTVLLEKVKKKTRIKDTDIGEKLKIEIHDLKRLIKLYQNGTLKER